MPYRDLPREYWLDPPEDDRKRVYRCAICKGEILEGDTYYDLPKLGPCCEECVEDSREEAELDEPDED